MKSLFFGIAALLVGLPAQSEQIYLLIKSKAMVNKVGVGVALITIPMMSKEQCEVEGARMASSRRFRLNYVEADVFECIEGK